AVNEAGVIDQPIRIREGSIIAREVGEGGKESLTRYWPLATDGVVTLLRVIIETGRTHQIRVHMSWAGHPLVGDTLYGDETGDGILDRHGLHCARMRFDHPITGESLALSAPLPADMQTVLRNQQIAIPEEYI
ncbi:MAG: RNA pseudouridine synthase, partial [Clostridia bacterium]|nr:RNA pseudouridine synthase [Clostridia bacterium]